MTGATGGRIAPPPWIISAAREAVNRSLITADIAGRFARKCHFDYRELTEAEQQPQKDWIARFEAVMEEGRLHDWIGWDEVEGTYARDLETRDAVRVYDETDEEHQARVSELLGGLRDGESIRIPRVTR